jgi:hypothetical protein
MTYPVLLAEEVGQPNRIQWRVWCPYCAVYHYHGAEDGHRVAHCIYVPESYPRGSNPIRDTGYYIMMPGKTRQATERAAKRLRRPSRKRAGDLNNASAVKLRKTNET